MKPNFALFAAVGLALTPLACSSSDAPPSENQPPGGNNPPIGPADVPYAQMTALRRTQTCEELLGAIQADILRKANDTIDAQVEVYRRALEQQGALVGREANAGAASDSAAPSSGTGSSAGPANGGTASKSASSYSETNTQVKGVDEADIVKNDGQKIYVLHGQSLQVVKAWPAESLATTLNATIEGTPTEMFVTEGRAVVFSQVQAAPVYRAASLPERLVYSDPYSYSQCWDGRWCGNAGNTITKVTVLTIGDAAITVDRELYFDGLYASARRIDNRVYTVLRGASFGPRLDWYPRFEDGKYPQTADEWIAAYEAQRVELSNQIKASSLADWLPYSFTKKEATVQGTPAACGDFFVPEEGSTQYGVTQIASFDLAQPDAPVQVRSVLGHVDTVYANKSAIVLGARAWQTSKGQSQRPPNRKAPFIDYFNASTTHLHQFDITDPAGPAYVASGRIPGTVLNQFSIDEKDGVIRVATTEQRTVRTWISDEKDVNPLMNWVQVNRVLTVRPQAGQLRVIGDAGDLAPTERIYSARFVGDRGYVVTFRQIDPLFVIDLAKPEAPRVLGQLKIPGFSEYMHPLDDGHLLTIGRDTDGPFRRGLALQIFDVTDAMKPTLAHKAVYDQDQWGSSEAEQNHKAFTYFAEKKLLVFPYYGYTASSFRSSAELFHIDVQSGIQKVGSVDHTALFGTYSRGYCGGYYGPYVRRGVFMDDVLYSISYGGIIATDTKSMGQLASVSLTAPVSEYYGCR